MTLSSGARRLPRFATVVAAALLAAPLGAQTTVQSTFGPGGSFALGTSYNIGADAPGVNFNRELATSFTYGGPNGFDLFDIGLALRNSVSPAFNVSYDIRFRRGADFLSSTELDSWSFGSNIPSPTIALQRFAFNSTIALQTGETYWIHLQSGLGESVGGWGQSDPAVFGAAGQLIRRDQENNPDWTNWSSPLPAYDVRAVAGTASVPEPALASLLLLGLAPIALRVRRRSVV